MTMTDRTPELRGLIVTRRKLGQGQLDLMREWMEAKIRECNEWIERLASMNLTDPMRGCVHDAIRNCEDAIDYYDACIRTGYTD